MTPVTERTRSDGIDRRTPIDWAALLAQHDRWLRTVAYSRVGDGHAVDEVMQEVALAAIRQRAPLADPAKAAPWLYRLAVVHSLLYRRKMGRQRKLTDRYTARIGGPTDEGREENPLGWLLAEERRKFVRTAMNALPRRDAEILLLKYTEGWSYHELAERLGISHSAVEARLHRAREKLRNRLAALESIEVNR